MKNRYRYKPLQYFLFTYLITWVSWFAAAYFSYQDRSETIFIELMIPGLAAPFGVALWMIFKSGNEGLKRNFLNKLFNIRLIRLSSIPAILLIMPISIVVSIFISFAFGESTGQLSFSEGFSFSIGLAPVLLVLFLAATFEELGWRSYAMDSLTGRFDYFTATLIFAFLWGFWHFPLFFINHYYQQELLETNIWFAFNFMVSVIPLAFIISWLCHKNSGSILVAILFHFIINISQEALQMTQFTKCIETLVLTAIAVVIIILNKKMFFDKSTKEVI